MSKSTFRTLFLAAAIAATAAPALAQASRDVPAAVPATTAQQGVEPKQIGAPAQPKDPVTTTQQRPGALQGFGPMQTSPLFGSQPMQTGGGKW